MSFLKKLFGLGGDGEAGSGSAKAKIVETLEHEGFTINAMPQKEGAQYRLAGTISKTIDGEVKTHQLIRADMFPNADECASAVIRKGVQVIKEQGEGMFR